MIMQNIPTYTLADILTATGALTTATSGAAIGVSIDTRTLAPSNLYVALRGERLDGHAFVSDALALGASFALVEMLIDGVPEQKQFLVPDTLLALQALAAFQRNRCTYRVIGVTGSVGKTSTKEMLALAMSSHYRTHATKGNYNNHIGLPLIILNTPTETECLVLEMGMNHAGEIALLSTLARPDAAIITTVEAVHLEFFDSVEGIARAKAEIVEGMAAGAPAILPHDNAHYALLAELVIGHGQRAISFGAAANADYVLRNVQVSADGTHAEIMARETLMEIHLRALGAHHAMNALSVLALCDVLGVNLAKAAVALHQYREPKGRGTLEVIKWGAGTITIIDETYNASPAAMNAAFARVAAIAEGRRTIAVLGDMLELGETAPQLHASLAPALAASGIAIVYTVGELSSHLSRALPASIKGQHFATKADLAEALIEAMEVGDILLFKGSRGSRIEEIITFLSTAAQYAVPTIQKSI
jgi:UDP-N-acetylmuramoyl-tripeptide--D-alanyl-D-alanine ligase